MHQLKFSIALLCLLTAWGCSHSQPKPIDGAGKHQSTEPRESKTGGVPGTPAQTAEPPRTEPARSEPPRRRTIHASGDRWLIKPANQKAAVIEDDGGIQLAKEIMPLPIGDRIDWARREFKKRGIDAHDDK